MVNHGDLVVMVALVNGSESDGGESIMVVRLAIGLLVNRSVWWSRDADD